MTEDLVVNTSTSDAPKPKDATKPKDPPKESFSWKLARGFWTRTRAFWFVVLTFVSWFLFVSLAKIVMRCAPSSQLWPWKLQCEPLDFTTIKPLTWPDTVILLTTLVVAIWAARRIVFPPDD